MFQAAKARNNSRVNEIQKEINNLYELIQVTGGKVIPAIKAAVTLLGRSTKWMKMFSLTLGDEDIEKVKRVIIKLGLFSEK
jgi:dihydrodipicolinate synthase/N-acetylneuraminate lyase